MSRFSWRVVCLPVSDSLELGDVIWFLMGEANQCGGVAHSEVPLSPQFATPSMLPDDSVSKHTGLGTPGPERTGSACVVFQTESLEKSLKYTS